MTVDSFRYFWASQERHIIVWRALTMAAAGIILGTITPYDTFTISSWIGRYLYWVGAVLLPALLSGFIARPWFPSCRSIKSGLKAPLSYLRSFLVCQSLFGCLYGKRCYWPFSSLRAVFRPIFRPRFQIFSGHQFLTVDFYSKYGSSWSFSLVPSV